ncbi:MAG: hydantoinase B/oxoprolinase family protein [Candidatus Heimdallarchaeota archaeon]|nr:hydantoinase B/oxoprolinase family protein [Candidatus Heimdallarchaeota archaeon]
MDPILVTILQNRLESIAEEMSIVLRKTAYSPNIKERADFSCAIFDAEARLLAQAEAIPVHLGSMGFIAKPILDKFGSTWEDGDAIIVNSPRAEYGGTHLPDISLVSPVFHNGELCYIIANRAHHADIGGSVPGSLPGNSTEVFQEGLIIPPVKIYNGGDENDDVMRLILENVRTPHERRGDLRAQYASLRLGVLRLIDLHNREPWDFKVLANALLDFSDRGSRAILAQLPAGSATFSDYLDSDGNTDDMVKITCTITIEKDTMHFDFTGSSPQCTGNVNAPLSITTAATYYVVRLITGRAVPTNEGCFRAISIDAPELSVVNPSPHAATSSANTETSQRIVDVLMGAVAKLIDFPAASQGTMNNVLLGGSHLGKPWTVYETIGGGSGASGNDHGTHAIHTHMTNTQNTPIESLELNYPIRVLTYAIREESGGKGRKKGGDGIIRKIELLDTATISLQTERRKLQPWGMKGGESGKAGINLLFRGDQIIDLGGRTTFSAKKGDILEIKTPGGGGYGAE